MHWIKDTVVHNNRGGMKGRQIRSYFMDPSRRVVDHRTGAETSDIDAVLDGEINRFMAARLEQKSNVS